MGLKQQYNLSKSVESALYICNKLGQIGKLKLNKLLYFADKYHLGQYGRTITGDDYKKLKYGPVPKKTFEHIGFSPFFHDSFKIAAHLIDGRRDPDVMELSDSDIEALDYSINKYGKMQFQELSNISHDETWHSAKMEEVFSLEQFLLTYPENQREEIVDYLNG